MDPRDERIAEINKPCDLLQHALDKLLSLREGDRGVLDVVAYGAGALPALQRLLFLREPSGLFQPRCRVVEAIAILGGHDILIDFLECPHEVADPVESAGEEAVMNAAARALRDVRDERVFWLLLSLAERRRLSGPIEVIGNWHRREALPCLVEALVDDLARPAAEDAIRGYGSLAIQALLDALDDPVREGGAETESSRRKRRATLALILELDMASHVPAALRPDLVRDEDGGLSVLGCRLALACGEESERRTAVSRLMEWLEHPPRFLRQDIEDCLVANGDIANPIVEKRIGSIVPPADESLWQANTLRALLRVAARMKSGQALKGNGPPLCPASTAKECHVSKLNGSTKSS